MQVNIPLKKTVDNSYSIYIDTIAATRLDTKVAIVTNPKVAGLHLGYLLSKISAKELYIITVPDGEEYKNQASVDLILESLFNHRFNRKSMLIAFGGGVIGDMTGYVASIMNNSYGKNLIGAFHQPQSVYIDPHFLSTLPRREFSAGVAEIVKMAVTFNREFFEFLESADLYNPQILQEAIKLALQTKAKVVAEDEKEQGLRAALNYGHTFAHVIESETKYKKYLHGEAVAIGMVMANETSVSLGLMSEDEALRVKNLLQKYKLETSYKIDSTEDFYEAFFLDKKSSDTNVTFILPVGIGDVAMKNDIKKELIVSVLERHTLECRATR